MPISSIWKRDFPFLGLWWEPLENNANIFYLKTEFPLDFFGLWWQPLENNINIFYLKTEFPCFFWACDGNLIWKRTGFPCLFRLFWKIMPISSIWKRDFRVFLACDGNLWKVIPTSSIWKRDRSGTRPEVLLHSPLRGVTRVWASMFYWFYKKKKICKKSQKKYSGTKDFQIDDIANIIPMLMVAKCKSSSKDQQSNSNPFNIGMIFAISSIWKLFFMHLGSVELMGLQMNIFYLKTIWWNSLGSLMKYYLLFEKCFSVLLEYLLFEK